MVGNTSTVIPYTPYANRANITINVAITNTFFMITPLLHDLKYNSE